MGGGGGGGGGGARPIGLWRPFCKAFILSTAKKYFDFTSDLFFHICAKILTVLIQI